MANHPIDSSLLDKAICFAVEAHRNTERKGKGFPYVVHSLEAMAIVATITADQELLAAAALHDVVEDTPTTVDDIRALFGDRVAQLVAVESDPDVVGASREETWRYRKADAIRRLSATSREGKIVALGDKLSNMRAIARDYAVQGDQLWQIFNVADPALHAWHYRGLASALEELADTFAYQEFVRLVDQVFGL